jgi:hypothetical protein
MGEDGPINDRDVWLQTAESRFAVPTVMQATALSYDQAAATGATIAAAKRLDLSATVQFFIVRAGPA